MVSQQDARGDGGALVFMIDTPEGSLLYQDTSGHWTGILHDLRPDVAILAAAGRGNVDGEPVQGSLAGFVARQASLVRAPKVILSHHDDWLPGFSTEIDVKHGARSDGARGAAHRAGRARLSRRPSSLCTRNQRGGR